MSKNPSIGTVPCPITKCEATATVHKFAHRAQKDLGRRFAGKLYAICPKHGRLGMDARPEMQEYILGNATLREPAPELEATPPADPAPPAKAPEPAQPAPPAPRADLEKPAPAAVAGKGGFGFFR